jgi:hypothetical protein
MKIVKLLVAGLLFVSAANCVKATGTLTISDGINPTLTIADNGPGDNNASPGVLAVQTNIGVWYLTLETAITKPSLGSATAPVMNLFIQADSSALGNLEITFSDNNFGPVNNVAGNNLTGFTFGVPTAPTTITYNLYSDSGNTVGAETTLVASFPTQPMPVNSSTTTPLSLTEASSLTEDVQLSASGATSLDANVSLQVVPEPGVITLGALGFAALFYKRLLKRA